MAGGLKSAGLATLAFARRNTLRLFEDIPADQLLHQPVPGGNHALWIVGHLAYVDDMFMTGLMPRASKLPENWANLFGQGSVPSGDASTYPAIAEIRERGEALRGELVGWFESMSEEKLLAPLPEEWKPFAPTYGAMMSSLAWHEGLHAGQLSVVRRSLGIGPKFG